MTDLLIVFFAKYFGYILVGLLLIFLARDWKKYLPLFWHVAAAAILSRGTITEAVRFFWQRSRPFVEQNIVPLVEHSSSSSFPSGHASFYFAIGTVLYFYNKKAGALFLLASLFIGISRVLAGLHWPSDIAGGAVIGIFSGILVIQLSKRISS
jgi:undecaprenyl-diphosphatase